MTSSSLVMPYRRDDSRAVNGDVSVSQLLSHELPKTAGGPGEATPGLAQAFQTVLRLQNSRIPALASSRP